MEFVFALKQHVGAPAGPVVCEGDNIKRGQMIAAKPENALGSNIFSSVDGKVTAIDDNYITIEESDTDFKSYQKLTGSSPKELIEEAGIVGLGGAGFPTSVKLNAHFDGDGVVIVNAAECEPILSHNIARIEQEPENLLKGLKIVMDLVNAKRGIIAIKEIHKEAIEKLKAVITEDDIEISTLENIYPMGEERAVVRECLGIELNTTQLPSAANAIVCNVETLARVAEAIEERKPCFSKNLTVIGKINGGNEPHVFMDVPVGTSVGEMIERAGGIDGVYGEIIMGGPFTGRATTEDAPITKTTGGIIVTIDFPDLHGASVGLLVCACGGSEERMRDICQKMNGVVKSVARCKQAIENKPGAPLKCERPGNCPGQAKNNIQFKKDGCEYIIIGNCSDCSNTVMGSAPKMGLKVFHQTDHVMRTIGHPLYRYLRVSKQVEQLPEGK